MTDAERLDELRRTMRLSKRGLAVMLGEHQTTITRWLDGRLDVPPTVLAWAETRAAPLREDPQPGGLRGRGRMTRPRLEKLLAALGWSLTGHGGRRDADPCRWHPSEVGDPAKVRLWEMVPPDIGKWFEFVAAPALAHPLPEGWVPHVDWDADPWHGKAIPRNQREPTEAEVQAEARAMDAKQKEKERSAQTRRRIARDKKVVKLRDVDGLSWHTIGERLQMSHVAAIKAYAREKKQTTKLS